MLFDLRGRGRRGTVRVIYLGLALLFGIGFVGLGVGVGTGGGGIFNAFTEKEGSSGTTFAKEIKKYEKLTQEHPNNAGAWEQLLKVQLHEAGNEAYVSNGQLTTKGKELFHHISQSWNTYLGLASSHPNPELAQLMVNVYSKEGLDEPASEVQVLQIVVTARPTAAYYSDLAAYAYLANNARVGDLASAKAVSLAPTVDQPRLTRELEAIKKNPTGKSEASTASKSSNALSLTGGSTGTTTAK